MNSILVGETAGRIWQHHSKSGPTLIKVLPKSVGVEKDLVLVAIGWLAREEKLKFEMKAKDVFVMLTDDELNKISP